MIEAFLAFKDVLGGFVSLMEYRIQNTFFAILMVGVVYNQYKIRRMIKEMIESR